MATETGSFHIITADWRTRVNKIREPLGFKPYDPPVAVADPSVVAEDRAVLSMRMKHGDAAIFVETAVNRKLSPVRMNLRDRGRRPSPQALAPFCSTTSVSIQATCPDSCVFKTTPEGRNGCFADAGFTHIRGTRMDGAAVSLSGLDVIRQEASAIRRSFGGRRIPQNGHHGKGRDLRLHVGGDVPNAAGAELLAAAAHDWTRRGGGAIWTFTHRWREVPWRAWGKISVLASVEDGQGVIEAAAAGYAPALVVDKFPDGRRPFDVGGIKIVPCPAETRGATCVDCRICLDRPLAKMKLGVAFEVHGPTAKRAAAQLM